MITLHKHLINAAFSIIYTSYVLIYLRTWYVHFPLMCVGLLLVKTPLTGCLTDKTPVVNKTLVFNHKGFYRPPPATVIGSK